MVPTEDLIARMEAQSRYDRAHCPPSNPLDAEAAQALRALQQEVERLRGALGEILDECPATCETSLAHSMADIARSALTGSAQGCCSGGPQWGHAWDCKTLP